MLNAMSECRMRPSQLANQGFRNRPLIQLADDPSRGIIHLPAESELCGQSPLDNSNIDRLKMSAAGWSLHLTKRRRQAILSRSLHTQLSVVAVLVAFLVSAAHGEETISGLARIVDGDTLVIGSQKIRLASIDAPETDQICLDTERKTWGCGIQARDRLADHIGNRAIDCATKGRDVYGRTLAVCTLSGENLNAWMVQQGWALAFVRYSNEYTADQEAARAAGRGLWSGAFIAPWDWRHRNRQTIILGATSVPVSAQAQLLAPVSANEAPSPECIIKGNVNRKGERIYFRPGQLDYSRIDMSKPGKRWFCTEGEAEAAGWRPAAR